ncbi:MAG: beta-ketoacyl synthase N-terminal-like domain-containing protein [bacterium]|nr:beta-ketoacyl synthase N-terminal-like domain-containing protein [bacterium]
MHVFLGANNIVSPLGFTTAANFSAISSGKSAVTEHHFPFSDHSFYCSKIDRDQLNSHFSKRNEKSSFTFLEKMCVLSIQEVLAQSNIDLADKNNLLMISTTKGNIDVLEHAYAELPAGREYLSEIAKSIADVFHCANTPLVVSNACISGLLAMIIAKRFIENNRYQNIIVCGADLVSEFTLSGFRSFSALSDEVCKPFDAARKGINLGEAAASILLSAQPLSKLIVSGGASANDANHISGPSRTGDGLFQAIAHTLTEANKKTVDFICAHGTATEYNDEMESVAFSRHNLQHLPVNSLKGYYGHTLGAAGVLESIIALESLKQNTLIASAGFETQGTTHLDHVIRQTTKLELQSCLKTASGFGGCNAAAIFEKIL